MSVSSPSPAVAADVPALSEESSAHKSYGQILKSTALIGGSSVINVAFTIIRSKAMAVLVGPSGVGFFGLYNSIVDLAQVTAGLGIPMSGVREVAKAAATEDSAQIARTATVLRCLSIVLGLAGGLWLVFLSEPVARLTFGGTEHRTAVALLAAAVFFTLVASGQTALIQGLRRIADLARFNAFSALASTVVTIPLVYLLGAKGIVPAIITIAAISVLTSWWYSRKAQIGSVRLTPGEFGRETRNLLRLGTVFMASSFFTIGSAYAIRIIVLKDTGVEGAGLYQAAWALGGLYAGFILQAMGTDFYPRLTAIADDHAAMNRLVNEQTEVSVLLAGPGVLATLTFAPLAIFVFYSSEFRPAIDLLRWLSLGMMLRILSWPIGFVIIAKGAQKAFFWIEAAAAVVNVGLALLLVPIIGLNGAGLAFFGLYIWHTAIVWYVVHRMSGFRWSRENIMTGSAFMVMAGVIFTLFAAIPFWPAILLGTAITAVGSVLALRRLLTILPAGQLPPILRPMHARLAGWLRP